MSDSQELIGSQVGDYRLKNRLGRGTFGTVYLSENMHDQSLAAVKVLNIHLSSKDDFRDFLNEARTIRLRHPHIIPILDFGLSRDDLPFLIMEYASGGTLRDRHPRGSKLIWQTIDSYVQQIASALQYAHDRRIIHRDVKPENILLSSDNRVQLSDFGIAKMIEHSTAMSMHAQIGTPIYMAPEQSQGKPRPASDQYSLAVIVYEWFAGQRLFEGGPLEVMLQHRVDTPPSLRGINPRIPEKVEQVLFKALAKAPEERFPTIMDFSYALHTALPGAAKLQQTAPYSSIIPTLTKADEPIQMITTPQPIPPTPATFARNSPRPEAQIEETILPSQVKLPAFQSTTKEQVQTGQSGWSDKGAKIEPTQKQGRQILIALLCLIALLGAGGGGSWLYQEQVHTQHEQATATTISLAHAATTTAIYAPKATATALERGFQTSTSKEVQYGFDPAHTRQNPYEQVINAKNVASLKNLWSYTTGSAITSSPIVSNGILYISSSDAKLYAFDTTCHNACQPLWSYQAGGPIYDSSVAVANGLLYVGSEDHKFYAFDATCRSACQPLWSYQTGNWVDSSPTVANGIVYVGSFDHKLYAFDASCRAACQPLWSYQTGGTILSSPAVANGIVYIGSYDKNLYAFDASCRTACQPLWSYTTGNIVFSSPAIANGMVYVGSEDHKFYAFDAACRSACQPLWSFQTGGAIYSSPTIGKGVVYIGSDDYKLYAFDATCRSACQPLWSFQTGGRAFGSPSVANGVVYVGSDDRKLYAFDASCRSACQPLWSFTTGNSVFSSPAVADGVVYVGSYDSKLYAFGIPTT